MNDDPNEGINESESTPVLGNYNNDSDSDSQSQDGFDYDSFIGFDLKF